MKNLELPRIEVVPAQHIQIQPARFNIQPASRENVGIYKRNFIEQPKSYFFDYNNPDQINSFADVVFKTLRTFDPKYPFNILQELPTLFVDTAKLVYKGTLSPLMAGEWDALKINTLINFSETMDILANPVKGYFMEGKEGFKKAFNRVNFDWDTGNKAKDMFLEVVSDPLNWITIGGKALTNIGAKATVAPTVKSIAKELGEELSEDTTKTISKIIINNLDEGVETGIAKAYTRIAKEAVADSLFKDPILIKTFTERLINDSTLSVLQGARKIVKMADNAESFIFKTSINSSLAFAPFIIKHSGELVKSKAVYIANQITKALGKYTLEDGYIPLTSVPFAEITAREKLATFEGLKILNDTEIPKQAIDLIAHHSTNVELGAINAIIKEYAGKPTKLFNALEEWVVVNHAGYTLDAYVDFVNKYSMYGTKSGPLNKLSKKLNRIVEMKETFNDLVKQQVLENTNILNTLTDIQDTWSSLDKIYSAYTQTHAMEKPVLDDFIDKAMLQYQRTVSQLPISKNFTELLQELPEKIKAYYTAPKKSIQLNLFDEIQNDFSIIFDGVQKSLVNELDKVSTSPVKDITNRLLKPDIFNIDKLLAKTDTQGNKLVKVTQVEVKPEIDIDSIYKNNLDDMINSLDKFLKTSEMPSVMEEEIRRSLEDLTIISETKTANAIELYNTLRETSDTLEWIIKNHEQEPVIIPALVKGSIEEHPIVYIKEIQTTIENIIKESYVIPEIDTTKDITAYVIKQMQIKSSLELLATPGLEEFVTEVQAQSRIGGVLYALLSDPRVEPEFIKSIINTAEGIKSSIEFKDLILSSSALTEEVKIAMIDVVEGFAQLDMGTFIAYSEYYKKLIPQKMADYINNVKVKTLSNLKDFGNLPENQTAIKNYITQLIQEGKVSSKYLIEQSHDAGYDTLVTDYLMKKLGITFKESQVPIVFDIETLGFNKFGDSILQIAYRIDDGELITLTAKTDRMPGISLMRKLTGLESGEAEAEVMNAFRNKFMQDSLPSEEEVLRKFVTDIKSVQNKMKTPVLVGHNIEQFDLPHINQRIKEYKGVNLSKIETVDTLTALRKTKGYLDLTPKEIQEVVDILDEYVEIRDAEVFRTVDPEFPHKFIESPNKDFARKLYETADYLTGTPGKNIDKLGNLKELKPITQGTPYTTYGMDIVDIQKLRDLGNNINDTLLSIKDFNRLHNHMYIISDDIKSMTDATNITQLLSEATVRDGKIVAVGTESGKRYIKTGLVNDYYNIAAEEDVFLMNHLTQAAIKIDRYRAAINKPELLLGYEDALRDMAEELKSFIIKHTNGINNLDPSIVKLRLDNPDVLGLYSEVLYIYNRTKRFANSGNKLIHEDFLNFNLNPKINTQLLEFLEEPSMLKTLYTDAEIEGFFINPALFLDHAEEGYELLSNITKLKESHEFELDRLSQLTQINDEYGLATPKAKSEIAALSPIYQALQEQDKIMGEIYRLRNLADAELDEVARKELLDLADIKYEAFKQKVMMYDAQYMSNILRDVFKKEPKDLAAYLYYHQFGRFTFKLQLSSLTDNREIALLLHQFLENRQLYEAEGIRYFAEDNGRVWIYLTKENDYSKLKRPKIESDFKIMDAPIRTPHTALHKSLENARASINRYSNNAAARSTGEYFSEEIFQRLEEVQPEAIAKDMISSRHYKELKAFDSVHFNRSILGDIEARKEIMPFTSRNILKNYSVGMQHIIERMDTQTKFTALMFDPANRIDSEAYSGLNLNEKFELFKNHPEYSVAVLVPDETIGYRLKQLYINTPQDVQTAIDLQAVVLPEYLYRMSRSIINDFKITNTLVKTLNKTIVGPTKTGYLSSLGFLVRNIVDSNIKSITATGSLKIIPHTLATMKWYAAYDNAFKDILSITGQLNKDTINAYFREGVTNLSEEVLANIPKPKISKEMFDLIHHFVYGGSSSGLSKTLQDYYDNIPLTLHRRSKFQEAISAKDIEEYLTAPEEVSIAKWLDVPGGAEILEDLKRLKTDKEYLLQARSMLRYTRDKDLNETKLYFYLRHPDQIPDDVLPKFNSLLKYKDELSNMDMFETMIYKNPWTASIMDANEYLEQIFRLSQYTYEILEKGEDSVKAMYNVIKTHFDYTDKTIAELYADIIFPFSTFTLKNTVFWIEAMSNSGALPGILRDVFTPIWDLDEYTEWDISNRRSIQYQILAGNIILNKDTGFNIKLSPSVLDTFNLLTDPFNTIYEKLLAPIRVPIDLATWNEEDYYSQEASDKAKKDTKFSAIPILGALQQRRTSAKTYYDDTGNLLNYIMPTLFGRTNVPKDTGYVPYEERPVGFNWYQQSPLYRSLHRYVKGVSYVPKKYPKRNYIRRGKGKRYYPKKNYARRVYPKKYYSSMNYGNAFPESKAAFYSVMNSSYVSSKVRIKYLGKYNKPVTPYAYRNVMSNKRSLYKDLYSSKGKSRIALRMIPLTKQRKAKK